MKKFNKILSILILSIFLTTPIIAKEEQKFYIIDDMQQTQQAYEILQQTIEAIQDKEKVEYIFLEVGYIQGERINTYLSNGSPEMLETIMQEMYPENRTEEYKLLLNNLHRMNTQLPNTIQVIGVGKDRKEDTLVAVEKILKPYEAYENIKNDLKEMQDIPSLEVFKSVKKKINAQDSIYGEVLSGDEWIELNLVINSILAHKEEYAKINLEIAYNLYKDNSIIYLGNSDDINEHYKDPYIITFTYIDSKILDWQSMMPKAYEDNRGSEKAEYEIIIKNSKAANPYGVDVQKAYKYVEQNAASIDIKDMSFKGLKSLDKAVADNKLFISGEIHGNLGSCEMQLYLIKYFHEKVGVNKILFEYNYAIGKMMDDYIQSGEEKLLEEIMDQLKGSFIYSKEFESMLRELHSYNQLQLENNKIEIIGIDIVRGEKGVPYLWQKIFEGREVPNIVAIEKNKKNYHSYTEFYIAIQQEVYKNYSYYEKELGKEGIFDLEMMLLSLTTNFNRYDDIMLMRESVIISMYEKLAMTYPKDKFFAQMGEYHASQEYDMEQNVGYSCSEYLNKYSNMYAGKVLSIIYAYEDSYFLGAGQSLPIGKDYPDLLYAPKKDAYYLIETMGEANPLGQIYLGAQDTYVSDALQYIINIYKKPAMNKYIN